MAVGGAHGGVRDGFAELRAQGEGAAERSCVAVEAGERMLRTSNIIFLRDNGIFETTSPGTPINYKQEAFMDDSISPARAYCRDDRTFGSKPRIRLR